MNKIEVIFILHFKVYIFHLTMNSNQEELAELHDSLLQVNLLYDEGKKAAIIAAFIESLAYNNFLWYENIKKFMGDEANMRLIRFHVFFNMSMFDLSEHQEEEIFQVAVGLVSSMLEQAQQSNDEEQPASKRFRSF
jgi:hypothetical protein